MSWHANKPRWRGQSGFFEIWFFVVFERAAGRAYWFRYTTFAPSDGGEPSGMVWAAAFDAVPGRAVGAKAIHPIVAYQALDEVSKIQIGASSFTPASCQGQVVDQSHALSWDLQFTPASEPAKRAPWFLDHRLPLPTKVVHSNCEVSFSGSVTVDGETRRLERAIGVQKHIWGTRRVDELFWLYCPHFDEDPAAKLEATSVCAHTHLTERLALPRITMLWLQTAQGPRDLFGTSQLFSNRVHREELSLRFRSRSRSGDVRVEADCAREALVGYVYRDPAGHDLYVAQCDIARCTVTLPSPSQARASRDGGASQGVARLSTPHGAAIEFHSRTPIAGVSYAAWDHGARPTHPEVPLDGRQPWL